MGKALAAGVADADGEAVAVALGAGVAPGETEAEAEAVGLADDDGAGVAVPGGTGTGAVGQLAKRGLNAVGEGDPWAVGVGVGVGVGAGVGVTAGEVAPGLGVAVATGSGVNDGHGGRLVAGADLAPLISRDTATAMAPMRTVATKVTAPHSRETMRLTRSLRRGPRATPRPAWDHREPFEPALIS